MATPFPMYGHSFTNGRGDNKEPLDEELWLACAGPLATLPRTGDKVIYYPQGHMEQVSALSNSGMDQSMPLPNLAPQVHCRVMALQLSAETELDEVYAQISLLPEPEGVDPPAAEEKDESPKRPLVHMFSKPLTASDTSTHGGFSIHRKAAEECLPPLNMNLHPPAQELVAKDLHGTEWHFRHIYRGQPKRHLLTTGWSAFVSQKKLVAGDVVIFLRGENGELRVGVRRATRLLASQPQIVLSNHSMHMGVVAAAAHAVNTRTPFCVFYKPRLSPSEFIIPVDKYNEAVKNNLSVGMRFTMKFEIDNVQERRYTGTVTGVNDLDVVRWKSSKWRCLEVEWDEQTIHERPNKVSPWEIEACSNAPTANPLSGLRSKRARGTNAPPPPIPDMTSLGGSQITFDSMMSPKFPRVLQGQELKSPGSLLLNDDMYTSGKSQIWSAKGCDFETDNWISAKNDNYLPEVFRSLGGPRDTLSSYHHHTLDLSSPPHKVDAINQRNFVFSGGKQPRSESNNSLLDSANSNPNSKAFVDHPSPLLKPGCSNSSCFSEIEQGGGHAWLSQFERSHSDNADNWMNLLPTTVPLAPSSKGGGAVSHEDLSVLQEKTLPPPTLQPEGSCKIFGFSLTDAPPPLPVLLNIHKQSEPDERVALDNSSSGHMDSLVQLPIVARSDNSSSANLNQEKLSQKLVPSESQYRKPVTVRSCTKVIKRGCMLGRVIDLWKLDSYDALIEELESMFRIEGDLKNPSSGWRIAYYDNEGDTLLVGDDPWLEFCAIAKKIFILSPEEVQAGLIGAKLSGSLDEDTF